MCQVSQNLCQCVAASNFLTWYQVLFTWNLAPGTFHPESGTWYFSPGIWHLALFTRNLAPGTLHLESGTWYFAPGVPGIWQLGLGSSGLGWQLLWLHLAFSVAAAYTCLIAGNWRGITRILPAPTLHYVVPRHYAHFAPLAVHYLGSINYAPWPPLSLCNSENHSCSELKWISASLIFKKMINQSYFGFCIATIAQQSFSEEPFPIIWNMKRAFCGID